MSKPSSPTEANVEAELVIFVPAQERQSWATWDFEGPRHPCFLCAFPVGDGQVVIWAGSGGSAVRIEDTEGAALLEALAQRGPVTAAYNIFFHPHCVPSICRRLLEDWERAAIGSGDLDG